MLEKTITISNKFCFAFSQFSVSPVLHLLERENGSYRHYEEMSTPTAPLPSKENGVALDSQLAGGYVEIKKKPKAKHPCYKEV